MVLQIKTIMEVGMGLAMAIIVKGAVLANKRIEVEFLSKSMES